jgi:hypothetical protein
MIMVRENGEDPNSSSSSYTVFNFILIISFSSEFEHKNYVYFTLLNYFQIHVVISIVHIYGLKKSPTMLQHLLNLFHV